MKTSARRRAGGRTAGRPEGADLVITQEQILAFLDHLREKGSAPGSLEKYRRDLQSFYAMLPEDKRVERDTLARWRAALLEDGYAPRTVNSHISAVNSLLEYLKRREYQLPGQLEIPGGVQPELTRSEYLRLLSTARALGRERIYLMVKVFACMDLTVQELPKLTVEAVGEGRLVLGRGRNGRLVGIPACLREELLAYARREGAASGPVFITRAGGPLRRTSVTSSIRSLARDAQVSPEKCNPRCLRKLYQSTMAGIEAGVRLLVEQSHERLLEQEQLAVGWREPAASR